MTIDDIMGTARPPTIEDLRRKLALHEALVAALGAQLEPTPSGHLYAILMAHGYTLEEYDAAIALMVKAGAVKLEGDLLTWCRP